MLGAGAILNTMNKTVKSVMLPNTPNGLFYKVGLICPNTDKEISKIEHVSLESENGEVYSSFDGYDSENNIIFSIENCPVVIMYQ